MTLSIREQRERDEIVNAMNTATAIERERKRMARQAVQRAEQAEKRRIRKIRKARWSRAISIARRLYAAGVGPSECAEKSGLALRTVMTHTEDIRAEWRNT
jgi:hypothetical protein